MAQATTSFSPLAALLPERTPPDLLYLETKWAALMSYGLTVKLLQDVLPRDEPLEAVTMRNHVLTVAQRLEDALGDEQWSCIDSCPAEWSRLPIPDGPRTVGIDGGGVGHMTVDTCGKPYLPTLHTAFKAHRMSAEVPRSSKESWCPNMAICLA